MAPHGTSGNKPKSGNAGATGASRTVEGRREILQAVVIADSFDSLFKPLTESCPRALLKLAGHSLIDYTLEFLTRSGVDEIFVFCCAFAHAIRDHIKRSKWNHLCEVLVGEKCQDLGEAMREIEESRLIKDDFILVQGDLVSNLNLKAVVQEHKERRKKEKTSVMTAVMRWQVPHSVNPHTPASADDDTTAVYSNTEHVTAEAPAGVFTLHPTSLKILQYQPFSKRLIIPKSVFENNFDFVMRHDLLDCNVSICSVDVPQLFADNYDYQSISHFVRGVLQDEEISGQTLYCHVLENGYMQRVSSLVQYHRVCLDILCRWPFPIVPDLGVGYNSSVGGNALLESSGDNDDRDDVQRFVYGRKNIYIGSNCCFTTSTSLVGNVLVDSNTRILGSSTVNNSSIGRNCQIGAGVTIENSHMFDRVVIGDNCVVRNAFLGNGVRVLNDSVIDGGCVLADEVKVGPHATLANAVRLCVKKADNVSEIAGAGDDAFFSTKESFRPRAWSNQSSGGHSLDSLAADHRLRQIDAAVVGAESNAVEYVVIRANDAGDSYDDDEDEPPSGRRGCYDDDADVINPYTLSTTESDDTTDADDDDPPVVVDPDFPKKRAVNPENKAVAPPKPILMQESKVRLNRQRFYAEISESVRRAIERSTSASNLIVEINGCRAAYNVDNAIDMRTVCKYVMLALMKPTSLTPRNGGEAGTTTAAEAKLLLPYYKKVFNSLKAVVGNFARTAEYQNECLAAYEHYCTRHWPIMKRICVKVLEIFYDQEILSDDVILNRFAPENAQRKHLMTKSGRTRRRTASSTSEDGDGDAEEDDSDDKYATEYAEFMQEVKVFVDWLENASSDEDD